MKVVDAWRAGLMCALIPFYALYWWYRTASDLQALGNETRNDNARVSPALVLVLVLLGGALVPLVFALMLLSQGIAAAQRQAGVGTRISPIGTILALVAIWLTGPVAIILLAAGGSSASALLAAIGAATLLSAALTSVFYEQLQFHLNSVWSMRRRLPAQEILKPQTATA